MLCLIFTQVIKNINLPKVCGLRNQVWPRFYLTFTQVISMTHNVTNKNMAELPFINNNTFIGYLHSRGAVQHFRLDLLGSIHLYQLPRWYGMTFPNNFPYAGFLWYPQPFLIPSPQERTVLTSHLNHTPIWVSADNILIELWHFLFVLQLGLGFFLVSCC